MNKAGVSRTTWLRIIMPLNAIQTKQIIQVRKMLLSLSAPRTFGRQCCQLFVVQIRPSNVISPLSVISNKPALNEQRMCNRIANEFYIRKYSKYRWRSHFAMSANEKGLPQAPAQGQQSLYPNPQPPSYEESTRPEPWTVPLQPVAQQSVPFGCISAIPMTQPSVPVVQRKLISSFSHIMTHIKLLGRM